MTLKSSQPRPAERRAARRGGLEAVQAAASAASHPGSEGLAFLMVDPHGIPSSAHLHYLPKTATGNRQKVFLSLRPYAWRTPPYLSCSVTAFRS